MKSFSSFINESNEPTQLSEADKKLTMDRIEMNSGSETIEFASTEDGSLVVRLNKKTMVIMDNKKAVAQSIDWFDRFKRHFKNIHKL